MDRPEPVPLTSTSLPSCPRVTWKADGTRYMLLLCRYGTYLVDRKFAVTRVQMRWPTPRVSGQHLKGPVGPSHHLVSVVRCVPSCQLLATFQQQPAHPRKPRYMTSTLNPPPPPPLPSPPALHSADGAGWRDGCGRGAAGGSVGAPLPGLRHRRPQWDAPGGQALHGGCHAPEGGGGGAAARTERNGCAAVLCCAGAHMQHFTRSCCCRLAAAVCRSATR
jgi:hypothetical protein